MDGGTKVEGKEKRTHDRKGILGMVGVLILLLLAGGLLWYGNATSNQAVSPMMGQVYFAGEYRIADGPWQTIVEGQHIPATQGDVTLRGNFHMRRPDGVYEGSCVAEMAIALYTDHIHLTVLEGDKEPYVMDMENPLFGPSACGVTWSVYVLTEDGTEPLEILIHNPHHFGNEKAVDELLANTAFWSGIDFEKDILEKEESQKNTGLFFLIVSLCLLGSALFSTLIHVNNSKILWLFGLVILFAGTYLTYSSDGIAFRSESVVTNTTLLGASMIFYMLFFSMALVHFFKETKKISTVAVSALGAVDGLLFALPVLTRIRFYDLSLYWALAQTAANMVLAICLVKEFRASQSRERWLILGSLLPLAAYELDVAMVALGVWKGGLASTCVFILFFLVSMVVVLRIIPDSINTLAKAKELETEKIRLDAQLAESRMSIMMSQIRPHFIYNTLGSIEQLCTFDPPKAGELVHNFAKYLRGNFGELDNPKPILMSREMEHVRYYTSIEKVRFPDMTFSFEMNGDDFHIPALSVQPLVENAIKHGLMKLEKGGTVRVVSYETDTHYCVTVTDDGVGFDTGVLLDDRKHLGIRNIRGRLAAMVNGTLEIESTPGVGTKVLITIPKEGQP